MKQKISKYYFNSRNKYKNKMTLTLNILKDKKKWTMNQKPFYKISKITLRYKKKKNKKKIKKKI